MKKALAFSALGLLAVSVAGARSGNSTMYPGVDLITEARLRDHLKIIASAEMGGRDTPSEGLNKAADYISSQLKSWGVQPGGDNGSYYFHFPLSRGTIDATKSTASIGGSSLTYGKDFFARGDATSFSGKIVFVGHGYKVASKNIDPYKDINVKGKVMLVLSGNPKDTTFREVRRSGNGVLTPLDAARKYGAVGIITVYPDDSDIPSRAMTGGGGNGWRLDVDNAAPGAPVGQVAIGPTTLATLLRGSSMSVDQVRALIASRDEGTSLPLVTPAFSANVVSNGETVQCQDVVAVIPGSDPVLKNEYILYGAHYDHLGESADKKVIYYGADDDGSGTTALLEIAHAYSLNPHPRRTIMLVWHAGEEKGLWGSQAFVTKPPIPLTSIATQINIDMIGRAKLPGDTLKEDANLTEEHATFAVGPYFCSPELGQILNDVNASDEKLRIDYSLDNYNDPERIFFRSDHYNYASKGIPIVFFFDGVHVDYHKPTDTWDKIDYTKHCLCTRLAYELGITLANRDKRVDFVNNMTPPAGR